MANGRPAAGYYAALREAGLTLLRGREAMERLVAAGRVEWVMVLYPVGQGRTTTAERRAVGLVRVAGRK
jgi:hypothetical protein